MRRARGRALHPTSHQRSPHLPIATTPYIDEQPLPTWCPKCGVHRAPMQPTAVDDQRQQAVPTVEYPRQARDRIRARGAWTAGLVSFIGARETVFQIEAMARNTLEHDLE